MTRSGGSRRPGLLAAGLALVHGVLTAPFRLLAVFAVWRRVRRRRR